MPAKLPFAAENSTCNALHANSFLAASLSNLATKRPITPMKKKHSQNRDPLRIINAIVHLRDSHLLRNRKLLRQEIDNK